MKVPADSWKNIIVTSSDAWAMFMPMMMPSGVDKEKHIMITTILIELKPAFARPAPNEREAHVL